MVETVVTTIEDEFKIYVKKYIRKREILVFLVCFFTFFLTIPNICPVSFFDFLVLQGLTQFFFKGGIFYFTIVDFFSSGVSLFYIAFFEIVAIVWVYGKKDIFSNI